MMSIESEFRKAETVVLQHIKNKEKKMSVSLPNKDQWGKVLTAVAFSFGSGFLATLTAQGGIQVGWGWEPVIALVGGALVAGINGALYTLYISLFKES